MGEFDPAEEARSAGNSGEGEMDGSGGKGPVAVEGTGRAGEARGRGKRWRKRLGPKSNGARA